MEVITLEEEENNVWLIHGHKFKYIFCDIDQLTDILFMVTKQHKSNWIPEICEWRPKWQLKLSLSYLDITLPSLMKSS